MQDNLLGVRNRNSETGDQIEKLQHELLTFLVEWR